MKIQQTPPTHNSASGPARPVSSGPEGPQDPQDGFSPRATVALATTGTALLGGAAALLLTANPANRFGNLLGGMVAGTIVGPAAASFHLMRTGAAESVYDRVGVAGLYGSLAGAGAGCLASLALTLTMPEGRLLEAATLALTTGGAVAGATLLGGRH